MDAEQWVVHWLTLLGTGSAWPTGSPGGMWGMAQDYRDAARSVRELAGDVHHAEKVTLTAYSAGAGHDSLQQFYDQLLSSDSQHMTVPGLADSLDQIAATCENLGSNLDIAQWNVKIAVATMVAMFVANALFGPAAPAADAGEMAVTRVAVQIIARDLMANIGRLVGEEGWGALAKVLARFAVKELGRIAVTAAKGAAGGALLMGAQDLGSQAIVYDLDHHQRLNQNGQLYGGINWSEVATSTESGAMMGAAGGLLHGPLSAVLDHVPVLGAMESGAGAWFKNTLTHAGTGVAGAYAAWYGNGLITGNRGAFNSDWIYGALGGSLMAGRAEEGGGSSLRERAARELHARDGTAEVPEAPTLDGSSSAESGADDTADPRTVRPADQVRSGAGSEAMTGGGDRSSLAPDAADPGDTASPVAAAVRNRNASAIADPASEQSSNPTAEPGPPAAIRSAQQSSGIDAAVSITARAGSSAARHVPPTAAELDARSAAAESTGRAAIPDQTRSAAAHEGPASGSRTTDVAAGPARTTAGPAADARADPASSRGGGSATRSARGPATGSPRDTVGAGHDARVADEVAEHAQPATGTTALGGRDDSAVDGGRGAGSDAENRTSAAVRKAGSASEPRAEGPAARARADGAADHAVRSTRTGAADADRAGSAAQPPSRRRLVQARGTLSEFASVREDELTEAAGGSRRSLRGLRSDDWQDELDRLRRQASKPGLPRRITGRVTSAARLHTMARAAQRYHEADAALTRFDRATRAAEGDPAAGFDPDVLAHVDAVRDLLDARGELIDTIDGTAVRPSQVTAVTWEARIGELRAWMDRRAVEPGPRRWYEGRGSRFDAAGWVRELSDKADAYRTLDAHARDLLAGTGRPEDVERRSDPDGADPSQPADRQTPTGSAPFVAPDSAASKSALSERPFGSEIVRGQLDPGLSPEVERRRLAALRDAANLAENSPERARAEQENEWLDAVAAANANHELDRVTAAAHIRRLAAALGLDVEDRVPERLSDERLSELAAERPESAARIAELRAAAQRHRHAVAEMARHADVVQEGLRDRAPVADAVAAQAHRQDCLPLAVQDLNAIHGTAVFEVPTDEPGTAGMTLSRLGEKAGRPVLLNDFDELRAALAAAGEHGTALVGEMYLGSDGRWVGHSYAVAERDGVVVQRDRGRGVNRELPERTPTGIKGIYAIVLDRDGNPVEVIRGDDVPARRLEDLAVADPPLGTREPDVTPLTMDAARRAALSRRDALGRDLMTDPLARQLGLELDPRKLTPEHIQAAVAARPQQMLTTYTAYEAFQDKVSAYLDAHATVSALDAVPTPDRVSALCFLLADCGLPGEQRDPALRAATEYLRSVDPRLADGRPRHPTLPEILVARDAAAAAHRQQHTGESHTRTGRTDGDSPREPALELDVRRLDDQIAATVRRDTAAGRLLDSLDRDAANELPRRAMEFLEAQREVSRQGLRGRTVAEHDALAAQRAAGAGNAVRAVEQRHAELATRVRRLDARQDAIDRHARAAEIAPFDRYADALVAHDNARTSEDRTDAADAAEADARLIDAAARHPRLREAALANQRAGHGDGSAPHPGPRQPNAGDRVVFSGSTARILADLKFLYPRLHVGALERPTIDHEAVRQIVQELHDVLTRYPDLDVRRLGLADPAVHSDRPVAVMESRVDLSTGERYSEILFNPRYLADPAEMARKAREATDSGHWPPGSDVHPYAGVTAHELGHALAWQRRTSSTVRANLVAGYLSHRSTIDMSLDGWLAEGTTKYAATDLGETEAESFAHGERAGESMPEPTRIVYHTLTKGSLRYDPITPRARDPRDVSARLDTHGRLADLPMFLRRGDSGSWQLAPGTGSDPIHDALAEHLGHLTGTSEMDLLLKIQERFLRPRPGDVPTPPPGRTDSVRDAAHADGTAPRPADGVDRLPPHDEIPFGQREDEPEPIHPPMPPSLMDAARKAAATWRETLGRELLKDPLAARLGLDPDPRTLTPERVRAALDEGTLQTIPPHLYDAHMRFDDKAGAYLDVAGTVSALDADPTLDRARSLSSLLASSGMPDEQLEPALRAAADYLRSVDPALAEDTSRSPTLPETLVARDAAAAAHRQQLDHDDRARTGRSDTDPSGALNLLDLGEAGVEPSAELRELAHTVRRLDDQVAATVRRDTAAVRLLDSLDRGAADELPSRAREFRDAQQEVNRQSLRARTVARRDAVAARNGMGADEAGSTSRQRLAELDARIRRLDARQEAIDRGGRGDAVAPYDRYADALIDHGDTPVSDRWTSPAADAEARLIDAAARRPRLHEAALANRRAGHGDGSAPRPGPRQPNAEDRVVFSGSAERMLADLKFLYPNIELTGLDAAYVDHEALRQIVQELHDTLTRYPDLDVRRLGVADPAECGEHNVARTFQETDSSGRRYAEILFNPRRLADPAAMKKEALESEQSGFWTPGSSEHPYARVTAHELGHAMAWQRDTTDDLRANLVRGYLSHDHSTLGVSLNGWLAEGTTGYAAANIKETEAETFAHGEHAGESMPEPTRIAYDTLVEGPHHRDPLPLSARDPRDVRVLLHTGGRLDSLGMILRRGEPDSRPGGLLRFLRQRDAGGTWQLAPETGYDPIHDALAEHLGHLTGTSEKDLLLQIQHRFLDPGVKPRRGSQPRYTRDARYEAHRDGTAPRPSGGVDHPPPHEISFGHRDDEPRTADTPTPDQVRELWLRLADERMPQRQFGPALDAAMDYLYSVHPDIAGDKSRYPTLPEVLATRDAAARARDAAAPGSAAAARTLDLGVRRFDDQAAAMGARDAAAGRLLDAFGRDAVDELPGRAAEFRDAQQEVNRQNLRARMVAQRDALTARRDGSAGDSDATRALERQRTELDDGVRWLDERQAAIERDGHGDAISVAYDRYIDALIDRESEGTWRDRTDPTTAADVTDTSRTDAHESVRTEELAAAGHRHDGVPEHAGRHRGSTPPDAEPEPARRGRHRGAAAPDAGPERPGRHRAPAPPDGSAGRAGDIAPRPAAAEDDHGTGGAPPADPARTERPNAPARWRQEGSPRREQPQGRPLRRALRGFDRARERTGLAWGSVVDRARNAGLDPVHDDLGSPADRASRHDAADGLRRTAERAIRQLEALRATQDLDAGVGEIARELGVSRRHGTDLPNRIRARAAARIAEHRGLIAAIDRFRAASANERHAKDNAGAEAEREAAALAARGAGDGPRGRVAVLVGRDEPALAAGDLEPYARRGMEVVYRRVSLGDHGSLTVTDYRPVEHIPLRPPDRAAVRPRPGDWTADETRDVRPSRAARAAIRDVLLTVPRVLRGSDRIWSDIQAKAGRLGIDHVGMDARELAAAVRAVIAENRRAVDEITNLPGITPEAVPELLRRYGDQLRTRAETLTLAEGMLREIAVYEQRFIAPADRLRARAEVAAARSVLERHGGTPVEVDGSEVARLVPGRNGEPDRLFVVSPAANPDHVLTPARRRALLGEHGEFVFEQARVGDNGEVTVARMTPPDPHSDDARTATAERTPAPHRDDHPVPEPPGPADRRRTLDDLVVRRRLATFQAEFWHNTLLKRAASADAELAEANVRFGDLVPAGWADGARRYLDNIAEYIEGGFDFDVQRPNVLERPSFQELFSRREPLRKVVEAVEQYHRQVLEIARIDTQIRELERGGVLLDTAESGRVHTAQRELVAARRAALADLKAHRRRYEHVAATVENDRRDGRPADPSAYTAVAEARRAVDEAAGRADAINDRLAGLNGAWRRTADRLAAVEDLRSRQRAVDRLRAAADQDLRAGRPSDPGVYERLADARKAVDAAARRIDAINDGAWRPTAEDTGGGRRVVPITDQVWLIDGGDKSPRVLVLGERAPAGRPEGAALDDAFATALAGHPELADVLRHPGSRLEYHLVRLRPRIDDRGEPDYRSALLGLASADYEVREIDPPELRYGLRRMGDVIWVRDPDTVGELLRWRDSDGAFHSMPDRRPNEKPTKPDAPRIADTKAYDKFLKTSDKWPNRQKGHTRGPKLYPHGQKQQDGYSGDMGAKPYQDTVEPWIMHALTGHWPEMSYDELMELWDPAHVWSNQPFPLPDPLGWNEDAHHSLPFSNAVYTVLKRYVQIFQEAKQHPWTLNVLQGHPRIGEAVLRYASRLPDSPFDRNHPVLRHVPVLRSIRRYPWFADRAKSFPLIREWNEAEHLDPADPLPIGPRQLRDIRRYRAVEQHAARARERYAADSSESDVDEIVGVLTRPADPLLRPGHRGAAFADGLVLARRPDGTPLALDELRARLLEVKNHIFRDTMAVRDYRSPDGALIRQRMDAVPHIVDAWNRLTGRGDDDGVRVPTQHDLRMLDYFSARARYLVAHPDATSEAADLHAESLDLEWAEGRTPLSGYYIESDGELVHPSTLSADERDRALPEHRIRAATVRYAPEPLPDPAIRRLAAILADAAARPGSDGRTPTDTASVPHGDTEAGSPKTDVPPAGDHPRAPSAAPAVDTAATPPRPGARPHPVVGLVQHAPARGPSALLEGLGDPVPPPMREVVFPHAGQDVSLKSRGEDQAKPWRSWVAKYFDKSERERFRVVVGRDGRLYRSAGRVLDTGADRSFHHGAGYAVFVMDQHGNLYVGPQALGRTRVFHSSYLAGAPVFGAGEVKVVDGRLTVLTDKSGHYKPDTLLNDWALSRLTHQGLRPAPDLRILDYDSNPRAVNREVPHPTEMPVPHTWKTYNVVARQWAKHRRAANDVGVRYPSAPLAPGAWSDHWGAADADPST